MRLLVIGHPFLLAHNQKKYAAMKQLGIEVRLLVPSRGGDRFGITDCEIHSALSRDEVVALKAWFSDSHMTYVHNPARIARVLREFEPHLIHIEEEPQALITVETLALQRALAPGARVTLFTWDNLLRQRRFPLDALKRSLRRYSLRRVAAVICGNQCAAELLRAEGRFSGAIEVMPQYGLDEDEHEPGTEPELRAELGLHGSIVIGYVGRFVQEKGLRLLVDALAAISPRRWKLLLVGSGPLENEIRQSWMSKFPGRIVLVPAVPYEQVPRYLRCVDIFVLPSYSTASWVEQFGLSLAQAMLLGICCIGSSSGAIPDVLGSSGIVFEERNTAELSCVLEELLSSLARREQVASQVREFALRNYTLRRVSEGYLAVFERVANCAVTRRNLKLGSRDLKSAARRQG